MGSSRFSLGVTRDAQKGFSLRIGGICSGIFIFLITFSVIVWLSLSSSTQNHIPTLSEQNPPSVEYATNSNHAYLPLVLNSSMYEVHLPYYGMAFVTTQDLSTVASLGINLVLQTFQHNGNAKSWLYQLDQAQNHEIKIIAWLYPQGWEWNGTMWTIDRQARLFIQTVSNHPALFAVYALHEPYWQGCWGCGYTTYQQQLLYNQIKEIAEVPVFSDIGSIDFWTNQGQDTAFADGVCDFCSVWFYPFTEHGYERNELITHLQAELAVARSHAPHSKIFWYMQAFAENPSGYRMPTAEEMVDLASLVCQSGIDGTMWYVWTFGSLYNDFLSKHPELYDTVRYACPYHALPRQ